jgi:hypothetical protein
MLYRIEIYNSDCSPYRIGNWYWRNRGEAINNARHWFNNWVTGDRDKFVLVRQQNKRKIVYCRLSDQLNKEAE